MKMDKSVTFGVKILTQNEVISKKTKKKHIKLQNYPDNTIILQFILRG